MEAGLGARGAALASSAEAGFDGRVEGALTSRVEAALASSTEVATSGSDPRADAVLPGGRGGAAQTHAAYLRRCAGHVRRLLAVAAFRIDDNHAHCALAPARLAARAAAGGPRRLAPARAFMAPPTCVTIRGVPASVRDRTGLLALLEGAMGKAFVLASILDARLDVDSRAALVSLADGNAAIALARCAGPLSMGLDRDGVRFYDAVMASRRAAAPRGALDGERMASEGKRMASEGERTAFGGERMASEGRRMTSEGEKMAFERERMMAFGGKRALLASAVRGCSRTIECILIERQEATGEQLVALFDRRRRLHNVECDGSFWHVHLREQAQVLKATASALFLPGGRPLACTRRCVMEAVVEASEGAIPFREQRPVFDAQRPGLDAQRPGIDAQRPGIDARRPRVDAQQHRLDAQRPAWGAQLVPRAPPDRPPFGHYGLFSGDMLAGGARKTPSPSGGSAAEEGEMAALPTTVGRGDLLSMPSFKRRQQVSRHAMEEDFEMPPKAGRTQEEPAPTGLEEASPPSAMPLDSPKATKGRPARERTKHAVVASEAAPGPSLPHEPASVWPLPPPPLPPPPLPEGCARLRPLVRVAAEEKIVYIAPIVDDSGASDMSIATTAPPHGGGVAKKGAADPHAATAGGASGRMLRAQKRRNAPAALGVGGGGGASLASRYKKLILARSSIHSWGLFAGEPIPEGSLVIEYVGERIRDSVASVRERKFEMHLDTLAGGQEGAGEKRSIASSYLFRLSPLTVLDANRYGNVARFINHSCEPVCVAKIISSDASDRIVFYARRHIGLGEEITYDYKFPREPDPARRVRCLCGKRACSGFLN